MGQPDVALQYDGRVLDPVAEGCPTVNFPLHAPVPLVLSVPVVYMSPLVSFHQKLLFQFITWRSLASHDVAVHRTQSVCPGSRSEQSVDSPQSPGNGVGDGGGEGEDEVQNEHERHLHHRQWLSANCASHHVRHDS